MSTNGEVKFLTHEVGSLAKPPWLVKTSAGKPLEESDIEHAREWGEKVGVEDYEQLVELLRRTSATPTRSRAGRAGTACASRSRQVSTGSGTASSSAARCMPGRSRTRTASSRAARCARSTTSTTRSRPRSARSRSREPYHNDEFSFLKSAAKHDLKIPITGAYTLAVWSYDEHHLPKEGRLGGGLSRKDEVEARRELTLDIARNIIRPNLEALIDLGATWIQIDEPGASTEEDELDVFVESFNVSVEGLDCMFSTHLCFSDYDLFFPAIEGMSGCRQYCVGFANYDTTELGTTSAERPGYEVISKWRDLPYDPILGLGVNDIHTDFIESPELVRDRILYAVDVFGDPARIHVCPDCGLRTRSWDVAYEKLRNMVEGTRLAEESLNRAHAGATK